MSARVGLWAAANLLTLLVVARLAGLAWWMLDGTGGIAAALVTPACVAGLRGATGPAVPSVVVTGARPVEA